MAQYDYKTSSGTKVSLTINSLEDITAVANDNELVCFAQKGFCFNPKSKLPALSTDLKIKEQTVNLEITEEIKVYINELKEEDKISKLPIKEQLKTRIQKLKAETNFIYFVDADLVTGKKYFTLTKKHDKNVWSKIAKYFTYINTSHHSDAFDAMYGSNFKGWLTDKPNEVDAILKDILNIDNTLEIAELQEKLDAIELKEKNDVEYRNKLLADSILPLKNKYPIFKESLELLEKKAIGVKHISENTLDTESIVNLFLEEDKKYQRFINNPEELPKITSSVYSGGYCYLQKEENTIIIPTKNYIVVANKPKYSKEWWNNPMGEMINGYFARFGACNIRVYKDKGNFYELLKKLGFVTKQYGEDSKYFLQCENSYSGYSGSIYNIESLCEDYNWCKKEDVLEKYKKEERWNWTEQIVSYPKPDEIKNVGKFLDFDNN